MLMVLLDTWQVVSLCWLVPRAARIDSGDFVPSTGENIWKIMFCIASIVLIGGLVFSVFVNLA